jgi:hypothetical protein
MRHKAIVSDMSNQAASGTLAVARHWLFGSSNSMRADSLDDALIANRRKQLLQSLRTSLGGTAITPIPNNPCLEYETPFYTTGQRFVPARHLDYYSGLHMSHELSLDVRSGAGSAAVRIDRYVSTAEDFQLGLFIGAPVYYVYVDPEAA